MAALPGEIVVDAANNVVLGWRLGHHPRQEGMPGVGLAGPALGNPAQMHVKRLWLRCSDPMAVVVKGLAVSQILHARPGLDAPILVS